MDGYQYAMNSCMKRVLNMVGRVFDRLWVMVCKSERSPWPCLQESPRTCMFEKLTRKQCRTPQFAQEDAVSLNPLLAGGFAPKPIFVAALVQRRAQSKQVLSTDSSTPLFVPLPHAHASLTLPIAARAADACAARVGAASHDACV